MGKGSYKVIKVINAGRIILGLKKGYGRDTALYENLEQGELTSDWVTRDRKKKTFGVGDYVLVNCEGMKRGIVQDTYKTGNGDERIYEVYLYDHGLIGQLVDDDVTALKRDWQQQPTPRTVIVQPPGIFPVKRVLNLAKMALGETSEVYSQTSEWPRKANIAVEEWLRADSIKYLRITVMKTNNDGSVYGDIVRKTDDDKLASLIDMLLKENLAVENVSHRTSQLSLDRTPIKLSEVENPRVRDYAGSRTPQPSTFKSSYVNEKGRGGTDERTTKTDVQDDEGDNESDYMSLLSSESSYIDAESSEFEIYANDRIDRSNDQMGIPGYLLVRGNKARPPYRRLEDLQLPPSIIKALESVGASDISKLQKAVAPTFMRGSDLIVIAADGGKYSGKHARLLSYFLPILRLMLHQFDTMENFDGCSPETIIVCNSFLTGIDLEAFIRSLLKFSQHVPLRVKFLHKDDPKEAWRLPNGVSILILTVKHLSEILQSSKGSKLFDKLRFMIYEELELYARRHFADLTNFIETASNNVRLGSYVPFQLTFSGSQWSNEVETLYKILARGRSPVVYIHAINQVVRYAKVGWIAHHVEQDEERINELISVLRNVCTSHQRIVVACSNVPVARAVHEALRDEGGIHSLLLTADTLQTSFEKCSRDILVIPDDRMASVDVTNATCVISFDSPEDGTIKKPTAALRFGYFWKNIRSLDEDSESDVNLVCHFLLTGKEHNFYALYKFSETLDHVTFPPLLKALAVEMELECSEKALCDGIKLFGFCNSADPERCPARHEFTKQDLRKFAHAPVTGEIEFRITRCESPSRYRVQLLRHFLFEDGKRKVQRSFISELKRRSDLIAECQAQEKNLQKTSFEVGNLYAVKDPESNGLTRCKITKILSKDSFDNPNTVHVNCIDTGISLNPSVDDLFQLSPEQEQWTPLVVELVLGDLKPSHGEMEYRPNHSKNARKLTTDKIYNAKIWLSIGNTVWVNPMVEYHIDPCTKQTVKGSSARLDLMRMGAADYNYTHLKSLSDLVRKHADLYRGCKELEIVEKLSQDDLSEIAAKEDFYQLGDDYRWAFVQLSSDSKFDPAEIMTMYGKDPWTFYGVHRKFEKTLNDLEVELSSCIENYISEKYITYEDMFVELYEPEMVIAAKDLEEDKKWNRAIILSRYKLEDQPSTRYELFFVDHGDKANLTAAELFPIPLKFVTRMPFQSIAFKLEHVVPLNPSGKWEENESEAFLDMILPNCDSVILQLVTLRSVENSDLPVTCRYYEAVAFLDDKELGEILVQESKAEFKTGAENMVAGIKERLLQFYNAVVNQHMGDDDDGESNAAGDNALAFGEEEDEDDRFEVHVDDAFIREFCGIKVNGMNQTASTENAALPTPPPSGAEPNSEQPFTSKSPAANTCGLTTSDAISQFNSSSKLTPTVKWRQNDTSVIFTIMVPDIEEFDVRLGADRRTICFQTVRPANYGFTIKSFGKVIKYEATLTGQTLALSFTKRMAGANWARVLSDKTLQPWWLKPDSDYLGDEDEVDEDGEESDGYEPWVYERDQEDEDTEFILALEADEELGEGEDFASDSD